MWVGGGNKAPIRLFALLIWRPRSSGLVALSVRFVLQLKAHSGRACVSPVDGVRLVPDCSYHSVRASYHREARLLWPLCSVRVGGAEVCRAAP